MVMIDNVASWLRFFGSRGTARYSGVLGRHIYSRESFKAFDFKKNLLWDGFQKVVHSLGYIQRNRDLKIRSRQQR